MKSDVKEMQEIKDFFFFFSDEIMMKLEVLSVFLFQSQESKLTNVKLKKTQPQRRHFDVDILNFS